MHLSLLLSKEKKEKISSKLFRAPHSLHTTSQWRCLSEELGVKMATASDSYAKDHNADIPVKEVDNESPTPDTGIVKDWDEEEGPLRRKYV